jgi:sugar/nucleoside kinase (ribokinase family)
MPHSPEKRFDVLGLGCTAVDDVVCVPRFPAADEKVRVERSFRRSGGLTGTALVTAARLGARAAYAGRLGIDEPSRYIAEDFRREDVDVSHAPRSPKASVVRSTIIVGAATGSRNIFYEIRGLLGAHDSLPAAQVIRASNVLFIDHYGMRGNLRATRIARSAGVAVVADFEEDTVPLFQKVLDQVDHLILAEDFALRIARESSAARAALALWRADRAAVIVTCGAKGCWCVSACSGQKALHYPAFRVRAADTTGCGDVFHGAYAASLARGDALPARIRFAAAAAALKAVRMEIPRLAAVNSFLRTKAIPRNLARRLSPKLDL